MKLKVEVLKDRRLHEKGNWEYWLRDPRIYRRTHQPVPIAEQQAMSQQLANFPPAPRVFLAVSALLLLAGGVLHALAFAGAVNALSSNPMPSFYSGSFKALWLIDSATLVSLGALLTYAVVRPHSVTRPVMYFLALIPSGTAALIYTFVGSFLPAHVFVVATVLMLAAGSMWRAFPPMKSDVA